MLPLTMTLVAVSISSVAPVYVQMYIESISSWSLLVTSKVSDACPDDVSTVEGRPLSSIVPAAAVEEIASSNNRLGHFFITHILPEAQSAYGYNNKDGPDSD